MRYGPLSGLAFFAIVLGAADSSYGQENPRVAFVSEYIRVTGELERLRDQAEHDNKDDPMNFANCVQSSRRIDNELDTDIQMLGKEQFNFEPPFDSIRKNLAKAYLSKFSIWHKMGDYCGQFVGTLPSDADIHKILITIPEMTADLETIDHALFEATELIFELLIDPKPDSKGHLSHIVATKAERDKIISEIQFNFGKKLQNKNMNYAVATASILDSYFHKGFKCADEPWD